VNVHTPLIGAVLAVGALAATARGDQAIPPALAGSAAVEQTAQGSQAPLPVLESFDGIADQLAGRWLVVMPIFRRAVVRANDPDASASRRLHHLVRG
jgi:hypothetical protein